MNSQTQDKNLLGVKIAALLQQWNELEPDRCKTVRPFPSVEEFVVFRVLLETGGFYDVCGTHPWFPNSVELALIDRAVAEAAVARGWMSFTTPCSFPHEGNQTFIGTVVSETFKAGVSAFGQDTAIAHLEAYVKAVRGMS